MADSQPVVSPPKAGNSFPPSQNHQSSVHEMQQSDEQANGPRSNPTIARFFTTSFWRQKFSRQREPPVRLVERASQTAEQASVLPEVQPSSEDASKDEEETQHIIVKNLENILIMKTQVESYAKQICKDLLRCKEDDDQNSSYSTYTPDPFLRGGADH